MGANEALAVQLQRRMRELVEMEHGWDGPGTTAPGPHGCTAATALVGAIIGCGGAGVPKHLNLSASRDGDLLLTLFGAGGREAEVWIEPVPVPGFAYLVEREENGVDLPTWRMRLDEVSSLLGWLGGGALQAAA